MTYPKYTEYSRDVVEGKIIVGKWVRLACERFLSYFQREDMYYDEEAVRKPISFIQKLKHFKGNVANKPFILEPWQINMIAMLFGFKWKKDNTRVCRECVLSVARKNGKSAIGAAILCYLMIEEAGAEAYCIANNAKQANLVFEVCYNFIESIDPKGKHFSRFRDTIKFKQLKSKLRCLASDAKSGALDGLNVSACVLDECHGYNDSVIPDVIRSAVMNREQPLLLFTSTASHNQYGFFKGYWDECLEILQGLKVDDALMPLIYTLDEGDDWKDEGCWAKANPNLGVSVKYDALKREIDNGIQTPSKANNVRIKNLNCWVSAIESWIPDDYVLSAAKKLDWDIFKGKNVYCSVDLSAVSDLTAVNFFIPPQFDDDFYYFKTIYFICESCLVDNSNSELYRNWVREGYLNVTSGNSVDYDAVTNVILEHSQDFFLEAIAYDQWNSLSWSQNCSQLGLPLKIYSQSVSNFNMPTKELERLILQNKVIFDYNPVTIFCFRNARLKRDYNNNVKVMKDPKEPQKKVDGVITMCQSLGTWLSTTQWTNEIIAINTN